MKHTPLIRLAAVALLGALGTGVVHAGVREDRTVGAAIEVVEQSCAIPEKCIPAALLRDAAGVAVIPNILKAGFIVGGKHGRGVVLVRTRDGGWSNPVFVTLTGGSIGWQAGATSTDLILVFRTGRSIQRILQNRGKLTLGADVGIAAGPIGREAGAATDAQLKAEIYSYSRSRGLFAGVSFEGAALCIDGTGNHWFYGRRGVTAHDIVTDNGILIPGIALKLRSVLAARTSPPMPPPIIQGPPLAPPVAPPQVPPVAPPPRLIPR
jgi:lipid-binding SYLF domain-containing protein